MSVVEPLSLGKPAAPSQQSLLALSWLNFFLAGMQTAFGPIAAAYLAAREWTAKDIGFVLSIGPRGGVAGHHRWRPRAGGCCYFPRTGWPRQFGGTARTEPALRRRRGRRGYPDDGPHRIFRIAQGNVRSCRTRHSGARRAESDSRRRY